MRPDDAESTPDASSVAVVVVLSGRRRGSTERLSGDEIRVGSHPESEIWLPQEADRAVAPWHATLRRSAAGYEIAPHEGAHVWVDGELVETSRPLASGDLLEIGREGPVLRFRLYRSAAAAHKTLSEVWADCRDCAIHGAEGPVSKAAVFLGGAPRELATQTSPWFRVTVLTLLLALAAWTLKTDWRSRTNADRLARVAAVTNLLERSERIGRDDLLSIRSEVEGRLRITSERVEALEARGGAAARVIEEAGRAIVFLQGSFVFVEPESGRELRFAGIGTDGVPLVGPNGMPRVGLDGDGPPVESFYTGTAFVASDRDLLITNRHVAEPWAFDDDAKLLARQGFEARMRRFVGYLPGAERAFEVELVVADDEADLAVLRCGGVTTRVAPLALDPQAPRPGDEMIVLGYPTGMRALLARGDRALLDALLGGERLDFWQIAERLAGAGQIAPLASRGIVAQVSDAWIAYDAETTQGGSGGPVLGLDGRVVAVTAAVLPEFGGSNLGVPATVAARLLEAAAAKMAGAEPAASPPPSDE